jgi:folate-binding protein YgfZ
VEDIPSSFVQAEPWVYDLKRTIHGIPEGPVDLVRGQALPLESTMELLNAISFVKGCYLGQELTARTYHTGVTRKRLLPVTSFTKEPVVVKDSPPFPQQDLSLSPPLPSGAEVLTKDGKKTGKLFSTIHNFGIAMIRLEHLDPVIENTIVVTSTGLELRVIKPHWWDKVEEARRQAEASFPRS